MSFKDKVKEVCDGVDVVFDSVGGDFTKESLKCLKWGARILIIGFASGNHFNIPSNIVLIKGATVYGCRAGEAVRQNPNLHEPRMRQLVCFLFC